MVLELECNKCKIGVYGKVTKHTLKINVATCVECGEKQEVEFFPYSKDIQESQDNQHKKVN